jgi:hypothetical protein
VAQKDRTVGGHELLWMGHRTIYKGVRKELFIGEIVMKKTQRELILEYITRFGSITPMEAYSNLGITKLATRISEMRRDGKEFNIEMETSKNKFGKTTRYARYSFK